MVGIRGSWVRSLRCIPGKSGDEKPANADGEATHRRRGARTLGKRLFAASVFPNRTQVFPARLFADPILRSPDGPSLEDSAGHAGSRESASQRPARARRGCVCRRITQGEQVDSASSLSLPFSRHDPPVSWRCNETVTTHVAPAASKLRTAFCACSRFSAWVKMVSACVSNVCSLISFPRYAGRQCITSACDCAPRRVDSLS